VVTDNVSAAGFMGENPGEMKVAGQLTSDEQLGFVFPPGSELKAAFDAALQSMMDDGTLEELNMKWGLSAEEAAAAALPDLGGQTITIAVENAYPPFNYLDEATSEPIGWDFDTVREICTRLNCVPEFQEAAWDGIFPAMEAGEYDVLADGVTITAERDEIVDFSIPYVTIGQVLLVRIDETRSVDEMKADETALISTQIGTTNEIVAKENFPEERIQSFEDFGAAILALLSGDVDGVVIDTVSAAGFMGENPGEMKVAGQLTSDEQLGFVFPPGSELKAAFDAALQSMMDDGTLAELNKKWGLE
jgi:polar amino acid transport system substrate-binding protein